MDQKSNVGFQKNAKRLIVVLAVVLVGLVGATIFAFSKYQDAAQTVDMGHFDETDAIYNGIYIQGISVGSLTKDEAKTRLDNEILESGRSVALTYNESQWNYTFEELGLSMDIDQAVEEAYQYGRELPQNEKTEFLQTLSKQPYEIPIPYSIEDEKIDLILQSIGEEIDIEPIEATLTRSGGKFVIGKEQVGLKLNIDASKEAIVAELADPTLNKVDLIVEEAIPQATEEMFQYVKDILGTYNTSFAGSDSGRATNINVGAGNIDGWVLLPGEVFSTNEALGPQTYEYGYRNAGVIIDGKLDVGIGGGVCQLSTTLYNAVLYSELEVVERRNHSLTIGYAPIGRDAAVAGDYLDFKFKNSTDYPIYIENTVSGSTLTATIYGHETRPSNRTLEFESSSQYTKAPDPKVVEDPTLPLGQEVVVTSSKNGINTQTYKKVYVDGQLIESYKITDSTYRSVAGEVRRGTGPAEGEEPVDAEINTEGQMEEPVQTGNENTEVPPMAEEVPAPPEDNNTEAPEPVQTPPPTFDDAPVVNEEDI